MQVVADPWEREELAAAEPTIVARMLARVTLLNKGTCECDICFCFGSLLDRATKKLSVECADDGKGPIGVTDVEVCAATAKNRNFLTPSDWHDL